MSKIMNKFRNLTTSSGLVLGRTKSSPVLNLFILTSFTRLSQIQPGDAGTLRNKVLWGGFNHDKELDLA